ncbi:MAG: caspase family protein [Magnetococcales bacterium]|nr:caspase family protein [Magnetococcales bacterium]
MSFPSRTILSIFLSLFWMAQEGVAAPTSYCTVAREIAIKGIDLYEDQPTKGLNALIKARESCLTDLGIGYNLGLAYYRSGLLKEARETWESVHGDHSEDYKTIVNLAWLRFEMGDDEEAHVLAFNGMIQYPKSVPLAHTKLYALLRMGRYLEAYDWLNRPSFEAPQLKRWRQMSADYVVETLWQQFHRGQHLGALRQAVNFLVKEYPQETTFSRAKDQLVMADIDPDAEIPYPVPLPHQVWPKKGDIDNRRGELDDRLKEIPLLNTWQKREDAFAVFIGISGYQRLPARYFGARDAQNMHRLLTKRGEFMDDLEHVKLRINRGATQENINKDLAWLLTKGRTNPNAKLLIYFSGLGLSWNQGEEGLLVPYDAKKGQINPQTAISLQQLGKALDQLPNEEMVIMIDACFGDNAICGSGDFNKGFKINPALFSGQGSWMVSALTGKGRVHGSGRQGATTYFMMEGMLGAADGYLIGNQKGPKDGWVSMAEAFHYSRHKQATHNLETDSVLLYTNDIRLTRYGGEK